MIRFNMTVDCLRCEKRNYNFQLSHAAGWGQSSGLDSRLAHESLLAWQNLCLGCQKRNFCDHALENPREKMDTDFIHTRKNYEKMASDYDSGVAAVPMSADNLDTVLLEERRITAFKNEDWIEAMEISWLLGHRAGSWEHKNKK